MSAKLHVQKRTAVIRYPARVAYHSEGPRALQEWHDREGCDQFLRIEGDDFGCGIGVGNSKTFRAYRAGPRDSDLSWETPYSFNDFLGKAEDFFAAVVEALTVPALTFVGLRQYFLAGQRTFEEALEAFEKHTLRLDEALWAALGAPKHDAGLVLEVAGEDLKGRLRFGPFRKEESGRYFRFHEMVREEAALIFDCDVWTTGQVAPGEIRSELTKLERVASPSVQAFLERMVV